VTSEHHHVQQLREELQASQVLSANVELTAQMRDVQNRAHLAHTEQEVESRFQVFLTEAQQSQQFSQHAEAQIELQARREMEVIAHRSETADQQGQEAREASCDRIHARILAKAGVRGQNLKGQKGEDNTVESQQLEARKRRCTRQDATASHCRALARGGIRK